MNDYTLDYHEHGYVFEEVNERFMQRMKELFPNGCTVLCAFDSACSLKENVHGHIKLAEKVREKELGYVHLLVLDKNDKPVSILVISRDCPDVLLGEKAEIDIGNIKIGEYRVIGCHAPTHAFRLMFDSASGEIFPAIKSAYMKVL